MASNSFKETIKNYLDKRAEQDELFAVTYAKENKTLDECCNYVIECAKNGGQQGYADEEVFSWAVHYYDEDDIKNVKAISAKVVVNRQVELTEEEKEQVKAKAIEIATNEKAQELKKDLIVNVKLTPEEIAEAKQKAIDKVFEEQKQKMIEKKKVKSTPKKETGTLIPEANDVNENEIEVVDEKTEPVVNSNGQISFF
jgi:hypothetical protein